MRKRFSIILIIIIILLVLLSPAPAISGMQDGITLCLRSLIPSIFPLLFMIALLSQHVGNRPSNENNRFLRPLGLNNGNDSIFILSVISGYPVGAVTIQDFLERGLIRKQDANRLMSFCNNAGPAYIFGISTLLFHANWVAWVVWGIQIISSCLVAVIMPKTSCCFTNNERTYPKKSVTEIMAKSVRSIAIICGWVLIFRVVAEYVNVFLRDIFPVSYIVTIHGILELSNGCIGLSSISADGLRFVLFNTFLSFGGLCVWMQIFSAAKNLITQQFYCGKALQTIFSFGLSFIAQSMIFKDSIEMRYLPITTITCSILIGILVILLKRKNSSKIRINDV